MTAIFSFFAHLLDVLLVESDSLESYLAGSSSLAELESRQQEWERDHGRQSLFV